jgi:hypothetical protein
LAPIEVIVAEYRRSVRLLRPSGASLKLRLRSIRLMGHCPTHVLIGL